MRISIPSGQSASPPASLPSPLRIRSWGFERRGTGTERDNWTLGARGRAPAANLSKVAPQTLLLYSVHTNCTTHAGRRSALIPCTTSPSSAPHSLPLIALSAIVFAFIFALVCQGGCKSSRQPKTDCTRKPGPQLQRPARAQAWAPTVHGQFIQTTAVFIDRAEAPTKLSPSLVVEQRCA